MLSYNLSNESIKNLFLNDFNSPYKGMIGPFGPDLETTFDTKHKINNYGFRDDNFIDNADILIAGCSFTYGIALDEKYIWPELIKQMTKQKCANIGFPGYSVPAIISTIFAYIRKFEKPKTIICLFPDLHRMHIPVIPGKLFDSKLMLHRDYIDKNNFPAMLWPIDKSLYDQPKFSKMPHEITDILPDIFAIWMSIQNIHLLEQFCFESNINLIWATWSTSAAEIINNIKSLADETYFKYYVGHIDGISYSNKETYIKDCHLNLKKEDKTTFFMAKDDNHWGSHAHIHFADFFYDILKKREII